MKACRTKRLYSNKMRNVDSIYNTIITYTGIRYAFVLIVCRVAMKFEE